MLKYLIGKSEISELEAENRLLSEKWHIYTGYCDLEKIKQNMISVKVFVESQENLEYYFTQGEFEHIITKSEMQTSKRVKKDLRIGLPIKYTRELILKIFNVDSGDLHNLRENYKTRFLSIFKNRDPKNIGDHVPYLSYLYTFEEVLPNHFLNNKGVQAVKELLWLVYSVVPNIEFCPLLIKLISLSLVFLSKEETFAYIKNLMIKDYSNKNLSKIRFRLRFNYEENKKLIPAFIESFKNITKSTGKEIFKKLSNLKFEVEILIEDMFFNLFIGYLNFTFLHKVFILYLNEGCKILFRVAYAILKTLKNEILDINKSEYVISMIKSKTFELKDEHSFFSHVYYFKLTERNNAYEEIKIVETFKPNKLENYYIPTINGESNIMSDDEIFGLWNIFPDNFKLKDARLIFSTDYQGKSLDKIYETCLDPENSCFNCFLIISNNKGDVFGVIMSLPFDKSRNGFYKLAYTALFVLRPFCNLYETLQSSDRMILCNDDKLLIGLGKEGPSLEIEKDLLLGFSYRSEIFGSPCLAASSVNKNENSFEISKLEVYILY